MPRQHLRALTPRSLAQVWDIVFTWKEGTHALQYAPFVSVYRALGFMTATMAIAQLCGTARRRAQPRHVPLLITWAVVLACLVVLVFDWGFSQLYVHVADDDRAAAAAAASDAAQLFGAEGVQDAYGGDEAGGLEAEAAQPQLGEEYDDEL